MSAEERRWLGTLTVEPDSPIVAGSYGTWGLVYTVGRYGIDNGGRLRLLFRYAWDGGIWQTENPVGDNYVTVSSTRPGVHFRIIWDPRAGRRPWLRALIVEIADEPLAEGDQVLLTLGDTRGGSPGHRAQTFVESDFRWLMDIEAFETGTWLEVPDCPVCPIISARPTRLVALAPTEAVVGEPFSLHLRYEDRFGNAAVTHRGKVVVSAEECDTGETITLETPCLLRFQPEQELLGQCCKVRISRPGTIRFIARDENGFSCCSNPIRVAHALSPLRHYWGDLHAQYNNALGTGSVREAMRYAREAAGIQFAGHQPNDFELHQKGWDEARAAIREFYEPGHFVTFLGYEWSGNTPAGGDRNVHFLGDDAILQRSSHWHVPDKSDAHNDRYPLGELYQEFGGRRDVLLVPHVGGRRCDLTGYYNPELEPVIEICSCHGRFEWLLREALRQGYIVGVIGGSDDHTGRPGAAYPTGHSFGVRGGLAAVYAPELTREGIFAALRARHCYATTGERIGLWVVTSDGHMMGDAYTGAQVPTLSIEVAGTAPIESVEILRGDELAFSFPLSDDPPDPNILILQWSGARLKSRNRQTVWTGRAKLTGARILAVEAIAFDHPEHGITAWNEHSVAWHSTTCGDYDSVKLTLDDPTGALIDVETPPLNLRFSIAELSTGPLVVDCGGIDQKFTAKFGHQKKGRSVLSLEWKDPCPIAGRNVYWVRATQADGEMAWSSPLYFTLGEPLQGPANDLLQRR